MPDNRQLLKPDGIHPAPGFSHIALAEGRRLAFFAGQVALAPDFSVIGERDLRAQTVAAMRNLETALRAADVAWSDVVRRTIYTTQPTEYETITAGIEEVQGAIAHPAQTVVGVTGFAVPGLLIEIEATAVLP